jgi:thioredoxin reductase (NADPH)
VYIGLIPNTELFKGQLNLNQWGYIVTDEKLQASIPGVFVAGDVRDKGLRQVATAIGDGAVAAVSAEHFVEELKIEK